MTDVNLPTQARSTQYPVPCIVEQTWSFDADNGSRFLFARVRPILGQVVQVQVSPIIFNELTSFIGVDVPLYFARQYKKRKEGSKYEDKSVDNCVWWVTDIQR